MAVFNSSQVFPISCRGVRLASRPLSSFRCRRSYSSSPSLLSSLYLSLPLVLRLRLPSSLSLASRLSVYPCRSRLLFAVASSQSSFMPPGGEDLITYGEWIRPVPLAVEGSRRCLKFSLLDVASRYSPPRALPPLCFHHLLSFLKISFTRHA